MNICIVGGGFSGTATAIHLLREASFGVSLTIIERAGELGRGVAYGVESDRFLLNVPAGRMGLYVDDEEHFFHFLRVQSADFAPGDFVPRKTYGGYVAAEFYRTLNNGTHRFSSVEDSAISIHRQADETLSVALQSGERLKGFTHVVLACGNALPSVPPIFKDLQHHRHFFANPWSDLGRNSLNGLHNVLLVGTSLTMVDVSLNILEHDRTKKVVAVSRRGLLPQAHRPHGQPPSYGHVPPMLVGSDPTALSYLKAIRKHSLLLKRNGVDWREMMASLRPLTPRLWETLPTRERARFLRHLRPYWDTHRHRIASAVSDRLHSLMANGDIEVISGRFVSAESPGDSFRVQIAHRSGRIDYRDFHAIVNCTGPESDLRKTADPLVASLLDTGAAQQDHLKLGLRVGPSGELIGGDGREDRRLYVVGPLLKGDHWEATAVPELRAHARKTARAILQHAQTLATSSN